MFESEGTEGHKIHIQLKDLNDNHVLLNMIGEVSKPVVMPFAVDKYGEYKITIVKDDAADKFTHLAIHSTDSQADAINSEVTDIDPDNIPEEEDGILVEIPQDQGQQYDDFARTLMEKGPDYTTYTANGDLQIAFKMMDIDVTDCDYILIKFAEPVNRGWNVAFWTGTGSVELPAESTEFRFDLEPSMIQSGKLPQICLLTLWGASKPLVAKVAGVYKHSTIDDWGKIDEIKASQPQATPTYYTIYGQPLSHPTKGITIIRHPDGTVKKLLIKP
ncbi:MAG: hypothetical protein K2M05_09300 [Paramuribaculum sp.]|nr:hypothetical protein [Paramuribaculum sp.]MDE6304238.1 hypothetical protein [Paramuribaculum sp.]